MADVIEDILRPHHVYAVCAGASYAGDLRAAVGRLFESAGLDANHIGKANWNPLRDVIPHDAVVCIKPNWVHHDNRGGGGLGCLVTHPRVIEAVLEFVDRAQPRRLVVGDAPIQGCELDKLAHRGYVPSVAGVRNCTLADFRLVHCEGGRFFNRQVRTRRGEQDYVLFDLGTSSLLEAITDDDTEFRVGMYAAEEMRRTHARGRHQYLVCREALEADVVIDMPKLKTHARAGVTAALKNVVGIAGEKSYLAHHRKGGTDKGGDCYPGGSLLKRCAEELLDASAARERPIVRGALSGMAQVTNRLNELIGNDRNVNGSWFGNDTVWRMTLDLQRILHYGRVDGSIASTPQRRIIHITDALIAGQGDGPLTPAPAPLGVLTLGSNAGAVDWVHAELMGFDPCKVPLIRSWFGQRELAGCSPSEIRAFFNGEAVPPAQAFARYGFAFAPPKGWRGRIERTATAA